MVREKSQMEKFEKDNIQTVLGDLEKDLSHVVNDINKVVFAAGSGGKKVVEVDQEGAKRLIDESKKANINKFVMLSSMGADNPEAKEDIQEYLKAKQNADEHLKSSGLNYAIVRPGALNNNIGTGKIELSKKLNKTGEISRADVAQTLVQSLQDGTPRNETFEILQGDTSIGNAFENL